MSFHNKNNNNRFATIDLASSEEYNKFVSDDCCKFVGTSLSSAINISSKSWQNLKQMPRPTAD